MDCWVRQGWRYWANTMAPTFVEPTGQDEALRESSLAAQEACSDGLVTKRSC